LLSPETPEGTVAKTDFTFSDDHYTPVADRIRLFYERFPGGRIVTKLVTRTDRDVVVRAAVFRNASDARPAATGWAAEREGDGEINTVACLENTETSAVGRALANLGLTASTKRPSREEMDKADQVRARVLPVPRSLDRSAAALDPELQRRADHATEVMALIGQAERLGLSPEKARVLRERLTRQDIDARTLHRVGRRLRGWVELRFDRVLASW
jgi:hypothetical protein